MQNDRSLDAVRYPSAQAGQLRPVLSAANAADALSSSAAEDLAEPIVQTYEKPKRKINIRWVLASLGAGIVLLLAAGFFLAIRDRSASLVKAGEFSTVELPLSNITNPNLNIGSAKSLKINGQLKISNSILLTPTSTPANPVAGQLYYDKTTNQLTYFNGQQFLGVGGSVSTSGGTANTTNITNVLGSSQSTVLLQDSSPGTQQSGNFNISGAGQVGSLTTSVISSNGGALYINPVGSTSQQGIAPGTPATVGLTSGTSTTGTGWANDASATKVTMGDVGGLAKSIAVHNTGGSGANHVQVALYDDDGNIPSRPGSLLAQSAIVNLTPNGITTVTIPTVNLSANTTYWLAVNTDDTTVMRTYNGGSKASCFASRVFGSMADPFGGCFFDDNNYTIYLNYLVGSGPTGSTSPAQFSLGATGQAVFRNSSDSTTAFQVQNSAGTTTLLDIDTTNGRIGIGKSTPAYRLDIAGGDVNISSAHSLRFGGSQVLSANSDGSTVTVSNLNAGGSISVQTDNFTLQDSTASHQNFVVDNNGAASFSNKTNSATGFRVQNASGSSILAVNTSSSIVTVTSLVVTGSLTVNGHVVTGGSTPGIAGGGAACTTPTVGVSGNDTSGTITVTTGTGCASNGTLATLTFAAAFGSTPHITLTAGNANALALGAYTDNNVASTTQFTINTGTTPTNTTTYEWNYLAVQ